MSVSVTSNAVARLLYAASGDARRPGPAASGGESLGMVPRTGGFLGGMTNPISLPPWLTEADVDFFQNAAMCSSYFNTFGEISINTPFLMTLKILRAL